jgi:hypothetical protein
MKKTTDLFWYKLFSLSARIIPAIFGLYLVTQPDTLTVLAGLGMIFTSVYFLTEYIATNSINKQTKTKTK